MRLGTSLQELAPSMTIKDKEHSEFIRHLDALFYQTWRSDELQPEAAWDWLLAYKKDLKQRLDIAIGALKEIADSSDSPYFGANRASKALAELQK